jgi:hypothetical protein
MFALTHLNVTLCVHYLSCSKMLRQSNYKSNIHGQSGIRNRDKSVRIHKPHRSQPLWPALQPHLTQNWRRILSVSSNTPYRAILYASKTTCIPLYLLRKPQKFDDSLEFNLWRHQIICVKSHSSNHLSSFRLFRLPKDLRLCLRNTAVKCLTDMKLMSHCCGMPQIKHWQEKSTFPGRHSYVSPAFQWAPCDSEVFVSACFSVRSVEKSFTREYKRKGSYVTGYCCWLACGRRPVGISTNCKTNAFFVVVFTQ